MLPFSGASTHAALMWLMLLQHIIHAALRWPMLLQHHIHVTLQWLMLIQHIIHVTLECLHNAPTAYHSRHPSVTT
jgi:hypothetical protein